MSDTTSAAAEGRWRDVSRLFGEALESPPDARAAFLQRATDDSKLRDDVAELLRAFTERGAKIEVPSSMCSQPVGRVGPYRLEERIAEGGMGVVWLGTRADDTFRKRVAVKLVKRGMDSRAVLRRFERERQVLADLEHECVARLLDGGVAEDGRPYLVMELVDGVPLDRYCEEHAPSLDDRLRLLVDVCDGVAAAHACGIVHRDLKPGNVLVTAEGRVKVVDFGIAKVLHDDGEGDSLLTLTAERMLTPRYASPEQMEGDTVSSATDVYSLGVLLYELLTGQSPYDLTGATVGQLRAIVGQEQPRAPSLCATARDRAAIRGELDVIALHALAKDPEARYIDASAMAEDLRRRLAGRPILARRETALGRTRRWVRRNPRLTAVTLTVVTLLATAAGVSLGLWTAARSARDEASLVAYTASLGAAEAALRDHRVGEARAHLEAVPERLRGFAWSHLWYRLDTSRGCLEPANETVALAYSPDNAWLAVGTRRGDIVRIYGQDGLTGAVYEHLQRTEFNPTGNRTQIGFHPVEPVLASPHVDGTVRILTVPALEVRATIDVGGIPGQAAYDPTGEYLAVTGSDRHLHVYRHPDYELVRRVEAHEEQGPMVLAFDSDGTRLATGSWDETARVWSFPELQLMRTLTSHTMEVRSLAFTADGDSLVTGSLDGTIRVHPLESGVREMLLRVPSGFASDLVIDPSDGTLWTALQYGGILRWDLDTAAIREVYHGPSSPLHRLALSADGRRVAAGTLEGAWVWNSGAATVPRVRTSEYSSGFLEVCADEGEFLLGQSDGRVRRFRTADLMELPFDSHEGSYVAGGGLVPSRDEVVVADQSGMVRLWDAASGRSRGSFALGETGPLAGFAVAQNGVLAAVSTLPYGSLTILDLDHRAVLHRVEFSDPVDFPFDFVFRPGSSEVWGSSPHSLYRIDARTGRTLARLRASDDAVGSTAIAFDTGGARVAAARDDRVVVFDVTTGSRSLELPLGEEPTGFAFHPTEPLLAVGLRSGPILLLDLELERVVLSLAGHDDQVRQLRFAAGGGVLLTAGYDAKLCVWRTP